MTILPDSPKLDAILSALSNQKRRGILHELSYQPYTLNQLAHKVELSLPAIHKHMQILESSELIIRRKSGRTNFVALNPVTFGLAHSYITQYKTHWGNANASLTNYIARMQE